MATLLIEFLSSFFPTFTINELLMLFFFFGGCMNIFMITKGTEKLIHYLNHINYELLPQNFVYNGINYVITIQHDSRVSEETSFPSHNVHVSHPVITCAQRNSPKT